ncbi:uncharacterized protein LOC109065270 [Scomber scombrus]|uniref:Uncharacterized protein LOC109065270 n=1 Tax=Scomber scombrus TaxID=13677 RepID=A0AAV1NUG6_SCOSC
MSVCLTSLRHDTGVQLYASTLSCSSAAVRRCGAAAWELRQKYRLMVYRLHKQMTSLLRRCQERFLLVHLIALKDIIFKDSSPQRPDEDLFLGKDAQTLGGQHGRPLLFSSEDFKVTFIVRNRVDL